MGRKIREIRKSLGMSQMELAEKIGVSFQQIQKYEKGINRISVERLQQIANALGFPLSYFFEERANRIKEEKDKYTLNYLSKEEKRLLQLFRKVKNKRIKTSLINHLKSILELEKEKISNQSS
jgi:transcriptional regulator with XRE-family HTH domain